MDRGRRDDRERDYHEDRGRPDARDRMPGWGGQRDERDHRGDHDWDRRPLASTGDGRGGAPRPWGGRQFETRYDSQGLQHLQSRPETMAVQAVHNSGARRDEPQRRYNEPSRLSDEPQRRHDEPSRWRDEPQRRYDESWEWRHRDEPQRRYDEPSRHHSETAYDGRRETLHVSGSRTQKRRLPDPSASTAPPVRRVRARHPHTSPGVRRQHPRAPSTGVC